MQALGDIALTAGLLFAAVVALALAVRWLDYVVTATLTLVAIGAIGLPAWLAGRALGWWS